MANKLLCPECDKTFRKESGLGWHMKYIHNKVQPGKKLNKDNKHMFPLESEKQELKKQPEQKETEDKKPHKQSLLTNELTEAAVLRLQPKVQQVPLTPDIFIGYMCAVARGYRGDMTDWLSLASRDFWFGRGINPYEVVSGYGDGGDEMKSIAMGIPAAIRRHSPAKRIGELNYD